MIGQVKIQQLYNNCTLDTLPRSLMLIGPKGCGKKLLCTQLSNKFHLPLIDLTDTIDLDTITSLYERIEPYLYIININKISVKEENMILKVLEEPLKNSYLILLAESELGILPTILNRCQLWYFQSYSKNELQSFITDDYENSELLLNIAQTPGQILEYMELPLLDMIALIDKMIDKIHIASVSNTLTLSSKLAFKDEKDKYNVDATYQLLLYQLNNRIKLNSDPKLVQAYLLTKEFILNNSIKNIDKVYLFENYLLSLRYIMRGSLA